MKKVLLALVVGLVLAGCGPTESEPTTSAAATTTPTETTAESAPSTTTTAAESPTTSVATTTTTTTLPDVTPPELVVTAPPEGSTVADSEATFTGTVEPGVQGVWAIPDHEAVVDAAGNWELTVTLASGVNELVFFTLDQAANETTVAHHVTYTAPMPCDGFEVVAEHVSAFPLGPTDWCGGWGYISSAASDEIVFDLVQVTLNVAGDESQGWSIVNNNPMLRYLPVAGDIEIRACPPEPGSTSPGVCGSLWVGPESWQFHLWDISDLIGFVNSSDELWRVLIDPSTGEIVWVEQWWQP